MDKPFFTELYSANYPSFPKQNNNNRLFRGTNKVAHKFKGINGRFYRSEVVCERSTLSDSHQSSDGQYDCLSLYKPFRWNRFCQSLHARSQNVEVVPTKKYPHFSCLHPRSTQLHSRHSALINKSQFRMETQSSNFSSDLCNLHYPRSRPFCNKSKQSSSEIHFMVPRSRCSGNQCFLNSLVQPAMLCISPLQSNYEMPKKFSLTKPRFSSLLRRGGRDHGFQFYYRCFTITHCCFPVLQIY